MAASVVWEGKLDTESGNRDGGSKSERVRLVKTDGKSRHSYNSESPFVLEREDGEDALGVVRWTKTGLSRYEEGDVLRTIYALLPKT